MTIPAATPPRAKRFSDRQREHFDELADAYADEAPTFDTHSATLFQAFVDATGARPGARLLEIGAGPGRYTIPLLKLGCHVDAVEMSPRALARLRARAEEEGVADRLHAVEGVAESVPLGTGYDVVYGIHLLHHVPDPVRTVRVMRDAARPGGVVACLEPNPINPAWYVYITLDPLRSWRVEYGMLRGFPWQLRRVFRRAGLSERTTVAYGAIPVPLVNAFPRLVPAEHVLRRLPGLRWACVVQIVRGVRR